MIDVDLHAHSLFSGCGVHTVIELLTRAREQGMAGLAVTDHGLALGGRLNSTFFERLRNPVPGVRLLKGVEANLGAEQGGTDFPVDYLRYCDIALIGIHTNTPKGRPPREYTDLMLATLAAHPYLDVVTHPNSADYPHDYPRLAAGVRDLGRAIELNNSKVALDRVVPERTQALLQACIAEQCPVVVNSDAHTLNEIGCDDAIRPLMAAARFPDNLVLNRTAEDAFAFIERRRPLKLTSRPR
jgi:putative hydrolase